jgi:hypothetical protein
MFGLCYGAVPTVPDFAASGVSYYMIFFSNNKLRIYSLPKNQKQIVETAVRWACWFPVDL